MVTAHTVAIALLNGLTWGVTIALIALGLTIIFGLLDIVNVAHGALYMMGAVVGWFAFNATGSFLVAMVAAPIVVGLLGVAIERTVVRPVEYDLGRTLIATFAVMLILQDVALLTFGPATQRITSPIGGSIPIGVASYPTYRIAIAVVAIAIMAALHLFLHQTRYGMWMRSVEQNSEMASALGVPTEQVYMVTFALGAALAALAGVFLAPIILVNHLMGLDILAVAFVVVVVGGLGSIRGVLVASLLFGLLENLGSLVVAPSHARIATLFIMLLVIIVGPRTFLPEATHA